MSYGVFRKGFSVPVNLFLQATCLEKDTLHVIPSIVLCKQRYQKYLGNTQLVCSKPNAGWYFVSYYAIFRTYNIVQEENVQL